MRLAGRAKISRDDSDKLQERIDRDGVRLAFRIQILMRSARHRLEEIVVEAHALCAGGWRQVLRSQLALTQALDGRGDDSCRGHDPLGPIGYRGS